ncbi:MAG TPA: hypothetical protein VHS78_12040 [Candidatus Elarobacter sp.]|nr:hypothetical protein [Candidatus Elarobacter sp.]
MASRRSGLSISELQEQIFQREGFHVSFSRLGASHAADLPPYAYRVMAPQGWSVSDWKRIRLAPYVLFFRDVTIYRGDETPIARDMKLGHLRDTYYKAEYGSLDPEPAEEPAPGNVFSLDAKREKRAKRSR